MSRLRRLVPSDRYIFVTCTLLRTRRLLSEEDFAVLAQVMGARRGEHDFVLTAWVLLADHWHAIVGPRYPITISWVKEAIKVSSTRRLNVLRGETGRLWQGRFFDRALRTMREYREKVEYIHQNPVRAGLAQHPEDWIWSSIHEYAGDMVRSTSSPGVLTIDLVRLPTNERTRI